MAKDAGFVVRRPPSLSRKSKTDYTHQTRTLGRKRPAAKERVGFHTEVAHHPAVAHVRRGARELKDRAAAVLRKDVRDRHAPVLADAPRTVVQGGARGAVVVLLALRHDRTPLPVAHPAGAGRCPARRALRCPVHALQGRQAVAAAVQGQTAVALGDFGPVARRRGREREKWATRKNQQTSTRNDPRTTRTSTRSCSSRCRVTGSRPRTSGLARGWTRKRLRRVGRQAARGAPGPRARRRPRRRPPQATGTLPG